MEYLRHCHGQFVALLASELVSGIDDDDSKNNSQIKRPKRKKQKVAADSTDNKILTVTSTSVVSALERLEFQDLVVKFKSMNNDGNNLEQMNVDGGIKPKAAIGSCRKRKSTKIKNAFKNDTMTAALLEEQERLFALSAAKVKESNYPNR